MEPGAEPSDDTEGQKQGLAVQPPSRGGASASRPKRSRMLPLGGRSKVPSKPPPGGVEEEASSKEPMEDAEEVAKIDAAEDDSMDQFHDAKMDEDMSSAKTEDGKEDPQEQRGLQALLQDGTKVTVNLVVDGNPVDFSIVQALPKMVRTVDANGSISKMPVGADGNSFFCQVCSEPGNIVCCDGCPNVYHQACIPEAHPSRKALESDEDPWFCPACTEKDNPGQDEASQETRGMERRTVKRKCSECQQSGGETPIVPCEGGCGSYLHHPSCRSGEDVEETDHPSLLCSNCRAEEFVSQEQQAIEAAEEESEVEKERPRRLRARSVDTMSLGIDETSDDEAQEDDDKVSPSHDLLSKRKRSNSKGDLRKSGKKRRGESSSKHGKRSLSKHSKRKRRQDSYDGDIAAEGPSRGDETDNLRPYRLFTAPRGMVRATPAYFFFLADNRFKIERLLSRKHRYFNRLPKSKERNELVAKEGALWWSRLRPSEHRRYMKMSMRDFEQRIIQWREEKTIREMTNEETFDPQRVEDEAVAEKEGQQQPSTPPLDEKVTYNYHQRLYLGTSVGSKPFAPEPGKSNNRILLELLQDIRFHPEPMFNATRSDAEPGQLDYSKMTIPHFDVHGPVSTCVGDECLGCTRGWNHFCPVLKRRFPAIEHRARLQPPLSSLMASRVGVGLRPRIKPESDEPEDTTAAGDLFRVRDKPETLEAKYMPPIPSFTLSEPSSRVDDTVTFIEEALAMKIPEPPRPTQTSSQLKKAFLSRGALPTARGRMKRQDDHDNDSSENRDPDQEEVLNKCGRCRTIIRGDTGCTQCRRAQLVINTSRRQPDPSPSSPAHRQTKHDGKSTSGLQKVQTTMLGRLTTKESSFDFQSEGDKAVSTALLGMRWQPNSVLPPQKVRVPNQKPRDVGELARESSCDSSSGDDSSGDESSENSESGENLAAGNNEKLNHLAEIAAEEELRMGEEDSLSSSLSDGRLNEALNASGRPQRSARVKAASSAPGSTSVAPNVDRQLLAKMNKREEDKLQKRCLSIAIPGILLAMIRRDPLELFAEPVSNVEGYEKIVKKPIDFGKIREKVLGNEYPSLGAFIADARLLCSNALAFNHPNSVYSKTAKELYEVLEVMQKRASNWIGAIKDAHERAWRRKLAGVATEDEDPFSDLRSKWPEAVSMLENGDWLRREIGADFIRTKENETAYYGSLAIRRAAVAAEASLAPYPDSAGDYSVVARRSHTEDEALRRIIDTHISESSAHPVELKDVPTWREEAIIKILRRVQNRRVEGRVTSENGCARCDSVRSKLALTAETFRWGRNKKKGELDTIPRVVASRVSLSTGQASSVNRAEVEKHREEAKNNKDDKDGDVRIEPVNEVAVSIRGSRIHGWGLFADQPFKKGDIVAEYVGEYISNAIADAREKMYQEQRIQDYQFRIDEGLVIDATLKGGHGRYINHNCNPNCVAKIIDGAPPNKHLKRVMITAQRDIDALEEITYDYQFPLELDLDSRIPCNCGSPLCRGFMNWDLPEKGSQNRIERTQKRGGNMRDRIRRLGRPLKKEA